MNKTRLIKTDEALIFKMTGIFERFGDNDILISHLKSEAENYFHACKQNNTSPHLIIDLTETTIIHSPWLAAFVGLHHQLKTIGNGLIIATANPKIITQLQITKLNNIFCCCQDVAEAQQIIHSTINEGT